MQLLGGGGVGVSGGGVVVSCPGAAGKRWNWRQPCRRRRDPKDRPPETYDVIGRFGRLRQVHPCTDRGHPTVYSFPQANQETSSIFFANSAQLGCRSGHDRVLFCQWYAGVLSRYMSIRAARSEASPPRPPFRPCTDRFRRSRNRISSRHATRPALFHPFRLPARSWSSCFPVFFLSREAPPRLSTREERCFFFFFFLIFGPGTGTREPRGGANRWW